LLQEKWPVRGESLQCQLGPHENTLDETSVV
jgi:hypothetical protein